MRKIKNTTYDIVHEFDLILKYLCTLNIDKYKGKYQHRKDDQMGIHVMLMNYLLRYGFHLRGGFDIGEYQVKHYSIDINFPIENEIIIYSLYDFTGDPYDIHLGFEGYTGGECSYSLVINSHTKKLVFNVMIWGSVSQSKGYDSLSDFMNDCRLKSRGKRKLYWRRLLFTD